MATENRNGPELTSDAKELLLEDYRYLAESFWRNEQTGETRVNWFIGIVTAVAGGLVALAKSEHGPNGEQLRFILIASLFALVVFGIATLLRIMKRNVTTDGYKADMDTIRQIFKDHLDPDHILLGYQPFRKKMPTVPINVDQEKKRNVDQEKKRIGRELGGLAHTVSAINSLLLGGLTSAAVFPFSLAGAPGGETGFSTFLPYGVALITFVLSFWLQFMAVEKRESEARAKLKSGRTTHAGGIVYKLENGTAKYLLVGPKQEKPGEWLLPKGHIETGEEYGEAALREVKEETGIVARLLGLIGTAEFATAQESIRAKYYLMEKLFETTRTETRRFDWFTFNDALRELKHDQNKSLLFEAERRRVGLSQPPSASLGASSPQSPPTPECREIG